MSFSISLPHILLIIVSFYAFLYLFIKFFNTKKKNYEVVFGSWWYFDQSCWLRVWVLWPWNFWICPWKYLENSLNFQLRKSYAPWLTRSLPRDVYIRRQNDHPGGQGRIYTSHLNFVFTHLSKPGHRRGCCCMSPRCLLRQFVDRCLLFWAFFIEKTVLLCFARFLSKWRETALWLFPDATSWYELYVWWLSLRRRSRRELSWFRLVESEGYEWRWIFAGRGN